MPEARYVPKIEYALVSERSDKDFSNRVTELERDGFSVVEGTFIVLDTQGKSPLYNILMVADKGVWEEIGKGSAADDYQWG